MPMVATVAFVVAAFFGPLAWLWLRAGQPVASAALSAVTAALIYASFFGGLRAGPQRYSCRRSVGGARGEHDHLF